MKVGTALKEGRTLVQEDVKQAGRCGTLYVRALVLVSQSVPQRERVLVKYLNRAVMKDSLVLEISFESESA